jgi:cbb3-type cytochrome c oxidase subunit III
MKLTKSVNIAFLCASSAFLASHNPVLAEEKSKIAEPFTLADAQKLKTPVPYTKKSIAQGRSVYMRNCTGCHGADGKATVDVVADATDLTSPKFWKNGTTEGEIFRSIREGQGSSMPTFKAQLSEVEIWHLVNYIRSLWPESARPPIQEEEKSKSN